LSSKWINVKITIKIFFIRLRKEQRKVEFILNLFFVSHLFCVNLLDFSEY
jgi:hypothetical protein